jgi:hypothetical protein
MADGFICSAPVGTHLGSGYYCHLHWQPHVPGIHSPGKNVRPRNLKLFPDLAFNAPDSSAEVPA